MDDNIRLKTPHERHLDIERELDFLDRQKQAAKRDYDRRIAEINAQKERVLKRLRHLAKEEAKRR